MTDNDNPETTAHNAQAPCPSCGHCPTCGRGGVPSGWYKPYYPVSSPWWQYYPTTPYWSTINGAAGNNAAMITYTN